MIMLSVLLKYVILKCRSYLFIKDCLHYLFWMVERYPIACALGLFDTHNVTQSLTLLDVMLVKFHLCFCVVFNVHLFLALSRITARHSL